MERPTDEYRPRRSPRSLDVAVRGLTYRVHAWGEEGAPPVFLLHGWADTGMSFQFLADEMAPRWRLLAPDWRGFGNSQWNPGGYWFPDYFADLDMLAAHFSPEEPVRVVGHSMGGNVAWMYAGIRPARVSHAVSLDIAGLPDRSAEEAPEHFANWIEQWHTAPVFTEYDSLDAVAARVLERAPRLPADRARFIARHWTRPGPGGRIALRHDPAHKRLNPVLYRRAEARACWRRISAQTLLVIGAESPLLEKYQGTDLQKQCRADIPGLHEEVIGDAGHMLHLENPAGLARLLDRFL